MCQPIVGNIGLKCCVPPDDFMIDCDLSSLRPNFANISRQPYLNKLTDATEFKRPTISVDFTKTCAKGLLSPLTVGTMAKPVILFPTFR